MIKLNYKTNNPRWGLSGIAFQDWASYSFSLGYLSNPKHYVNSPLSSSDANISVHIEQNKKQGAWDKEGRIHYYGTVEDLKTIFTDFFNCSSAGTRNITRRINSNGYVISLVNDYKFQVKKYVGYTTADIFPPELETVKSNFIKHLVDWRFSDAQISAYLDNFYNGYNL